MIYVFWSLVAVAVVGSLVWSKIRTRRRLAALAAHDVPTSAEITNALQGRRHSTYEIESRGAMGNVPYNNSSGGSAF